MTLTIECTLYGVGHKKNAVLIIEDSFSAFILFSIKAEQVRPF